jgi:hypothetical protein
VTYPDVIDLAGKVVLQQAAAAITDPAKPVAFELSQPVRTLNIYTLDEGPTSSPLPPPPTPPTTIRARLRRRVLAFLCSLNR